MRRISSFLIGGKARNLFIGPPNSNFVSLCPLKILNILWEKLALLTLSRTNLQKGFHPSFQIDHHFSLSFFSPGRDFQFFHLCSIYASFLPVRAPPQFVSHPHKSPTSNPSPSPCVPLLPPPRACFHLSINRKSLPYTSPPLFILPSPNSPK